MYNIAMIRAKKFFKAKYDYVFALADLAHYNLVTWIIRKTIGINERAAGIFEANISTKQVVGLSSEIRPLTDTQISSIGNIPNVQLFPELTVELEQYKPLFDIENNQN